jgi:mannose/fructose/N-acetylgalactosamine-specific phosphotransferase system component IIB
VDLHLDDRLLHGRILHGWMPVLNPARLLLVSPALADARGQALYADAAAELGAALRCLAPGGAPPPAPAPGDFWLTDAPDGARWLLDEGLRIQRLVIIGLREAGGRALAADLQAGESTLARLGQLARAGVQIVHQPFPGEPARALRDLLAGDGV